MCWRLSSLRPNPRHCQVQEMGPPKPTEWHPCTESEMEEEPAGKRLPATSPPGTTTNRLCTLWQQRDRERLNIRHEKPKVLKLATTEEDSCESDPWKEGRKKKKTLQGAHVAQQLLPHPRKRRRKGKKPGG